MHEMHSLLFAALETFSLILLRKTNIQKKKRAITFTSSVSLQAVLLIVSQFVWSVFYTISDYG